MNKTENSQAKYGMPKPVIHTAHSTLTTNKPSGKPLGMTRCVAHSQQQQAILKMAHNYVCGAKYAMHFCIGLSSSSAFSIAGCWLSGWMDGKDRRISEYDIYVAAGKR